ncbi:ankyrin repeat-containing protein At5g02620-like [Cornus florida]|uniref:ankyrin repeat-containing protein At5g02620-like n=1 Tax=Cornus florida TaxID=4283 RepID=UPI002899040B|nr:ankyrin repeat-containing protein At5g02620-like [Cornus florida]
MEQQWKGVYHHCVSYLEKIQEFLIYKVIKNCFNETVLHVAVLQGHENFVKEILQRKPELAGELDSQQSSPLHLASANGNVEIVELLLLVKPDMCGVLDGDGRNPLHLAAINGRVDVLDKLIQASPSAARAPLDHGQTNIMHLCVQHNQLEALKLLVEEMNDEEFVNSKDEHEATILQVAVADKQIEGFFGNNRDGLFLLLLVEPKRFAASQIDSNFIHKLGNGFVQIKKYLLSSSGIKINEVNVNELTALDILAESERCEGFGHWGLSSTSWSIKSQRYG